MPLAFQVTSGGPATTGAAPTTLANPYGPGAVITIVGNGPNATANIVGPHNDASDLWGILVVLAVIFLAIAASRWIFGRGGPGRGAAGAATASAATASAAAARAAAAPSGPSGPPAESDR